jgi:hypothetical protein
MFFAINICAEFALPKVVDFKTLTCLQTLVLASIAGLRIYAFFGGL